MVLLFLMGAALIGLGLTDYIPEDMSLYVLGGGGVLILLVLIFWWLGRRKRKMAMSVRGRRPGLGEAQEMRALNTSAVKAIGRRKAQERANVKAGRAMEMRALRDPRMGTT